MRVLTSRSNNDDPLGSLLEREESITRDAEVSARDLLLGRPDGRSANGECDVRRLDVIRSLAVRVALIVGRSDLDDSGRDELAVGLDSLDAWKR